MFLSLSLLNMIEIIRDFVSFHYKACIIKRYRIPLRHNHESTTICATNLRATCNEIK